MVLTVMQSFLVPPAPRVPQHVLRGPVDVPQGESAEQLVPAGQGDRVCRDSSQARIQTQLHRGGFSESPPEADGEGAVEGVCYVD